MGREERFHQMESKTCKSAASAGNRELLKNRVQVSVTGDQSMGEKSDV